MSQPTASDFALGDRVQHMTDPHGRNLGVVVDYKRDLVGVKWASSVHEWVPPFEIKKVLDGGGS